MVEDCRIQRGIHGRGKLQDVVIDGDQRFCGRVRKAELIGEVEILGAIERDAADIRGIWWSIVSCATGNNGERQGKS